MKNEKVYATEYTAFMVLTTCKSTLIWERIKNKIPDEGDENWSYSVLITHDAQLKTRSPMKGTKTEKVPSFLGKDLIKNKIPDEGDEN